MVKVLPKAEKRNRPTKNLVPFSLYSKRSLTYRRLPEQLLKLSVLKLDGTSFSFHVARNATVAMLKLAVQEEFNPSLKNERKNLWSLVWSHFCLCHNGQKLIDEKACIQKYGIKDGDQLHFIQHLTTELAPAQQPTKNQSIESKQRRSSHDSQEKHLPASEDQDLAFAAPKSKLTDTLKELLSCSKHRCSRLKALKGKTCS